MNESKGEEEERIHVHMCTIVSTCKNMQAHASTHPQDLLFLESPQKSGKLLAGLATALL